MTMENVRKHRDIKLVRTDKRKSYSVSETNYHTVMRFSDDILTLEINKTEAKMNKIGL